MSGFPLRSWLPLAAVALAATAALWALPARGGPESKEPAATPTVTIRVAAVGDVMFGRYGRGRGHPYSAFGRARPFQHVRPLLGGHDIVMANLETPITAARYLDYHFHLSFRAPSTVLPSLRDAGVTLAITANNHAADQGARGLRETLDALEGANLVAVGTGPTPRTAWFPYVMAKQGVTVAVLAATTLSNRDPPSRRAGLAYLRNDRVLQELPLRVLAIRPQVDFIVVSLHFGNELDTAIFRPERRLIQALEEAGVDVIFGHGPHVLRAVERRASGMVVFYSLGNFLFDYGRNEVRYSGIGAVELKKRGRRRQVGRARFLPIIRGLDDLPRPATGSAGARVRQHLFGVSQKPWNKTRLVRVGDAYELQR